MHPTDINWRRYIKNHTYIKEYGPLFLLSIIIGIAGGLGSIIFKYAIQLFKYLFFKVLLPFISFYVYGYNIGIIVLPTLGGLLVGLITTKYAKEAKGHGVPEIIEAVRLKGAIIRPIVAIAKIFASAITIGSGGSAGREGPIAQIGGTVGSFLGRIFFKAKKYRRLMVTCGVAAGISATFNAPLGGAIFAMEVILGPAGLVSSVPILISSVIGDVVVTSIFGFSSAFSISDYAFQTPSEIPIFLVMGLLFGILSFVWSKSFYRIERFFDGLHFKENLKPMLGGLLVGIIGMFFFKYELMGVGYADIDAAIIGKYPIMILFILGLMKILATSFTIGSGGSGGIFAPSLYIGAMFGGVSGLIAYHFFPQAVAHPHAFVLIGMGALFAGACKTPVTSLIMIPEITRNYYYIIPMIIVITFTYIVSSLLSKNSMYFEKLANKGIKIKEMENILEDVNVEDIMVKKTAILHPNDKISDVMHLMVKCRHPAFPVVNDNKEFIGFVKVYDIAKEAEMGRSDETLKRVMDKDYPQINPQDSVYHAVNVMTHHSVGRLPVIKEKEGKKHLIGIISKTDVVKAYELLME